MKKFSWYLEIMPIGMFSLYDYPIPGKDGLPLCEEHIQLLMRRNLWGWPTIVKSCLLISGFSLFILWCWIAQVRTAWGCDRYRWLIRGLSVVKLRLTYRWEGRKEGKGAVITCSRSVIIIFRRYRSSPTVFAGRSHCQCTIYCCVNYKKTIRLYFVRRRPYFAHQRPNHAIIFLPFRRHFPAFDTCTYLKWRMPFRFYIGVVFLMTLGRLFHSSYLSVIVFSPSCWDYRKFHVWE